MENMGAYGVREIETGDMERPRDGARGKHQAFSQALRHLGIFSLSALFFDDVSVLWIVLIWIISNALVFHLNRI